MKSKFSLVLFLISISFLSARDDIRIISSTEQSLILEYRLEISDTGSTIINGQQSYRLGIYLGSDTWLPHTTFNIGVPSEFGNTIEIVSTQHTFLNGSLLPISPDEVLPVGSTPQNPELVSFGEYGISRDLQIQSVQINPVAVENDNKRIKLYNKIIFRINFSGSSKYNLVKLKDGNAAQFVLNRSVSQKWGINQTSLKKDITSSVLATGNWYRFEAPAEGIYRIGRSQLSALGIDANNVDPKTIKIYNQGGKRLNWAVENNDPTDLNEIAIRVVGEDDGAFNTNDAIIFYGRGTDFWEYSSGDSKVKRFHNPYSKKNYYWITSGGTQGKRISNESSLSSASPNVQTETKGYASFDDDKINIGKSGIDSYGDQITISNNTLTYISSLPGIIPNSQINYNFRFTNTTFGSSSLAISESDQQFKTVNLPGYGSYSTTNYKEYSWGYLSEFSASHSNRINEERSVLKFRLSASSNDAAAYIDYYEIEYSRSLRAYEDQIVIYSEQSNNEIEMRAYNFSNSQISVFNISDYANVSFVAPEKLSGGEVTFQIQGKLDKADKYIVISESAFKSVANIESVSNSNIHEKSPGADYIVITDRKFSEQAERFANYRENESPNRLKTIVIYTDEIMNEFAGGSLDPTAIRNFLRHAYLNWEQKPFYVLLFGDGTYDYLDLEGFGTNYVPTFQTENSMTELVSFPFDDFYARIIGNDQKADLAIGRINVLTTSQASDYIDKVIAYETDRGQWRNKVTMVGDDGITSTSNSEGSLHINQAEQLAEDYLPEYFNKEKIYLPKYPTVISGFGRRKPAVNQAIINAVNNGTLILSFTGHGNPDVWAHEFIFERSATIPAFNNDDYFFLVAATCDFGLYDNPNSISGTEDMVLLKDRGAIGVFSASRVVYSHQNFAIAKTLLSSMFLTEGVETIGEAFYNVKLTNTQDNDEKFHLFCDPAIRVSAPSKEVRIDEVNNVGADDTVQVGALSEVNIEGTIRKADGSVDSQYFGEGILSVFDAERKSWLEEIRYNFVEQGGVLFRGRVSAEAGKFNASFRVPKDISYEENSGKIVAYFFNDQEDGIGFRKNLFINGTDTTVTDDGKGPEIELFYDDMSSASAYLVNPDFNLFIKLKDETGLNTTGTGVGHKLEGKVDDDDENPIDFANFFVGDLNAAGKSGTIDYKFSDMPLGEHKINIKAWDVFNNSTSAESFFTVVSSDDLAVKDVLNYPNPFGGNTTFTFQHNLSNQLDVKVKVYTIAGRVIKEIESKGEIANFVRIPWDGKDEDGNELANGTYLYKLIVKSTDGEYQKSVLGKLAVFR